MSSPGRLGPDSIRVRNPQVNVYLQAERSRDDELNRTVQAETRQRTDSGLVFSVDGGRIPADFLRWFRHPMISTNHPWWIWDFFWHIIFGAPFFLEVDILQKLPTRPESQDIHIYNSICKTVTNKVPVIKQLAECHVLIFWSPKACQMTWNR